MLILAIDTSGKSGGVALARGDAAGFQSIGSVALAGGSYSSTLVPQVEALLDQHGLTLESCDAFAVAAGPGSFTGLRVGLATVKGFAEILDRPIAAVSVLEAIADQARFVRAAVQPPDPRGVVRSPLRATANDTLRSDSPRASAAALHRLVFAALDAGRNEVYCGEFRVRGGGRELAGEMLLSREALVAHVRGQEQAGAGPVVTPDADIVHVVEAGGMPAIRVRMPVAADIARLALQKLLAGETVPVATLDANYIRRSDAEIFSLPKLESSDEGRRR